MLIVSNNGTKISFIILIGGRSRRYGSDKGIFEFIGKPLFMHQLETLSQFERKIYLVAHSKSQVELYQKKIKITKNYLTNPALDPIAKIPEFKVCSAKLEKI